VKKVASPGKGVIGKEQEHVLVTDLKEIGGLYED